VDSGTIEARRDALIAEHGSWIAYNVSLAPGVYSMGDSRVGMAEFLVQSITQAVADLVGKPLDELRVLDLACHEGGFAIELGLHGAEVLGIEARPANIEKARFAAEVLGLDRVTFEIGDVRDLTEERLGRFDVVLCLGILYHLEAPDAVRLIERCFSLCDRIVVIRSAVGLSPDFDEYVGSRRYRGRRYREDVRHRGASIDNPTSIWPTRASLLNLLADVGFSSVLEVRNPFVPGLDDLRDSVTYVAVRGERATFRSVTDVNTILPELRRPERRGPSWIWAAADPQQGAYWRVRERVFHTVRNTLFASRRHIDDWRRPR
jgi:predicted RNA methylase